jgi:hypothetical protein
VRSFGGVLRTRSGPAASPGSASLSEDREGIVLSRKWIECPSASRPPLHVPKRVNTNTYADGSPRRLPRNGDGAFKGQSCPKWEGERDHRESGASFDDGRRVLAT